MTRLFFVAAFCAVTALHAQTLLLFPFPQTRPVLSLRLLHILPNLGAAPLFDGAMDVTVNVPTDQRFNAVASIALTNDSRLTGNTVAFGNAFIGMQVAADSLRRTVATIGIYLPTSPYEESSAIPLYVNRYEIQRYARRYTTAYFNVAREFVQGKDYTVHGELGTMYLAAGHRGDTSTVSVHYGIGAGTGNQDIQCTFEYAGMVSVAKSFLGLGNNRFLHFICLGATYMGKHV